jgi:hypothetical protein
MMSLPSLWMLFERSDAEKGGRQDILAESFTDSEATGLRLPVSPPEGRVVTVGARPVTMAATTVLTMHNAGWVHHLAPSMHLSSTATT